MRRHPNVNLDRLVQDMHRRGWEQKDLATAATVDPATVSRFLNGPAHPILTLKKLARALGYSHRRYLLGRERAA